MDREVLMQQMMGKMVAPGGLLIEELVEQMADTVGAQLTPLQLAELNILPSGWWGGRVRKAVAICLLTRLSRADDAPQEPQRL